MEKEIKKKIYEVLVNDDDDDTGVYSMSLVDFPAIEQNFVFFSSDKKLSNQNIKMEIQNEEKRIVSGPALIPEQLVYRISPEGEEYYVKMTSDTIQKLVQKFFKHNNNQNVDIFHDGILCNGIYLFESYITDDTKKAPEPFNTLPQGTWMVAYKIDNPLIWNCVKDGTFQGFSISALFDMVEIQMSKNKIDLYKTKEVTKGKSYKAMYNELLTLLESYFKENDDDNHIV